MTDATITVSDGVQVLHPEFGWTNEVHYLYLQITYRDCAVLPQTLGAAFNGVAMEVVARGGLGEPCSPALLRVERSLVPAISPALLEVFDDTLIVTANLDSSLLAMRTTTDTTMMCAGATMELGWSNPEDFTVSQAAATVRWQEVHQPCTQCPPGAAFETPGTVVGADRISFAVLSTAGLYGGHGQLSVTLPGARVQGDVPCNDATCSFDFRRPTLSGASLVQCP